MNFKVIVSVSFAIALFLNTLAVKAQTDYKMGVIFGSNYSSLRSDLFTTSSGRLSATAGFSILLGFGQNFELNTEIAFAQKGAIAKTVQYNPENKPSVRSYEFFFNSFEAGVFAGYQPFETVPVRLQAGGFFGTNFHQLDRTHRDMYVSDYDNIVNATQVTLLNEAFSGMDFGPALGISAGSGRFNVSARYYLGARNMYRNIPFATDNHKIYSSTIRVALTYYFKDRSTFN